MKYVALLSGGKDSCYNLLHCSKNGHELVAAASLGPELGKEELDSYLYQTVGQDAIEFVGRALDVPLYRRVISGAAVEQGGEYGGRDPMASQRVSGDETEDLYELLASVKAQHPDIKGVSVGAILSNYQRVRVEHVCRRLALTPLCYLWQRDQEELLTEMIEAGMEAILIKVAGIGLTSKHLGKTLAQMQQTLMKLNSLYGSHVCGEGGEYETLTLDCPLFKHRIQLDEVETVVHSDNDFATVAYVRIKNASLVPKECPQALQLAIPPLFSEPFSDITNITSRFTQIDSAVPSSEEPVSDTLSVSLASTKRVGKWIAIANVQLDESQRKSDLPLEDEVRYCFETVKGSLQKHSLTLANCANINVFLASMDLFAQVNAVYATYFGTSPPSRACVALDLTLGVRVRLDCFAYAEGSPHERQALHVQGLSYWAPANIGPYSQAIVADERVFISGQIGLIPSSLVLPSPRSLSSETALSFQHAHRVVEALKNNSGGGWTGHAQAIVYWLALQGDVATVRAASMQYEGDARTPTIFVVVRELPRSALVEKQVLVHTGQCELEDDDGTLVHRTISPKFITGAFETQCAKIRWEVSHFTEVRAKVALLCVKGGDPLLFAHFNNVPELQSLKSEALSIRLFYKNSIAAGIVEPVSFFTEGTNSVPITPIPSRYIATKGDDDWDYAILATCT